MKNQNRENEEKDKNTHRQEIEEATGKKKVGEGAIRKRRTKEEIATKSYIAEGKDTKEKVEQKNRQYLQCITRGGPGTKKKKNYP